MVGRIVLFLGGASVLASQAAAQGPVSFGDIISSPGFYYLDGDQSGTGDGISIRSDDVTLFLGRFTLDGDGTSRGVEIDGHHRVRIVGGKIRRFSVGIDLLASDRITVLNTEVSDCASDGIRIDDCNEGTFRGLLVHHNDEDGIFLEASLACEFVGIHCHDNGDDGMEMTDWQAAGVEPRFNRVIASRFSRNGFAGLNLVNAEENTLLANRFEGNTDYGLVLGGLMGSHGNLVRQNLCYDNERGIHVFLGSEDNELFRNRAFDNFVADLCESNPGGPCPNAWQANTFATVCGAGSDCID